MSEGATGQFQLSEDHLGGYGYLMGYPVERFWRDLRVHSILEGTNQIMRLIVGRDLLRE